MAYFTKFCRKHSRYKAKKPPASPCEACQAAYDRERQKSRIVTAAAHALVDLMGVDVTLEARYHRTDGLDDCAIRVEIQRFDKGQA